MTVTPSPSVPTSISDHATSADAQLRRGFGPRVRKLHARIGKAHHQAEGMSFSRSLLAGEATPLQLAALLRALVPAYRFIEEQAPAAAAQLGCRDLPWQNLARSAALEHDVATLQALPATAASAAAALWLERLRSLAQQAPHRLMAHVYVRYGGDLSGGQQLAQQANAILKRHGLPPVAFWHFPRPSSDLKHAFHDALEQLDLSEAEEEDLLDEAVLAFHATQKLLAELGEVG